MSRKNNRRRVSMTVSSQTLYHLDEFARAYHKNIGWVVDKLVWEKMISLHEDHFREVTKMVGRNHE